MQHGANIGRLSSTGAYRVQPGQRAVPEKVMRFALGLWQPSSTAQRLRIEQDVRAALKALILSTPGWRGMSTATRPLSTRMAVDIRMSQRRRIQRSLLADTVFRRSHVPLSVWFRALGLFVTSDIQGISARRLQKELGVGSYRTALDMVHKIRSLLAKVQPMLVPPLHEGRLEVPTIWPAMAGRAGGNLPIWIIVEAKSRLHRVRILYDGATPGTPHPHLYWKGPGAESMPPACQAVADGLVPWLRCTHRKLPLPNTLQPYLNEYAFRHNIRMQKQRRDVLLGLIRVAIGETLEDPFSWSSLNRARAD